MAQIGLTFQNQTANAGMYPPLQDAIKILSLRLPSLGANAPSGVLTQTAGASSPDASAWLQWLRQLGQANGSAGSAGTGSPSSPPSPVVQYNQQFPQSAMLASLPMAPRMGPAPTGGSLSMGPGGGTALNVNPDGPHG